MVSGVTTKSAHMSARRTGRFSSAHKYQAEMVRRKSQTNLRTGLKKPAAFQLQVAANTPDAHRVDLMVTTTDDTGHRTIATDGNDPELPEIRAGTRSLSDVAGRECVPRPATVFNVRAAGNPLVREDERSLTVAPTGVDSREFEGSGAEPICVGRQGMVPEIARSPIPSRVCDLPVGEFESLPHRQLSCSTH